MKLCLVLCLCWVLDFGSGGQARTTIPIRYYTKQNSEITIKIMVHLDKVLTRKLAKEYGLKTRKKLKTITNNILEDARRLFKHSSLNQTIKFKLLDTRFLRNNKVVAMDENASKYLKNYCDQQSIRKIAKNTMYYSVLLTGLDLFHVQNGRQIRTNSGRGYTRGMCNVRKSCSLLEWDRKAVGFLLAHEIGHSLGMNHDGLPYNRCKDQKHIMAARYDPIHHPTSWSPCSFHSLKQYLKSSKSWCVKNDYDQRVSFRYL